MAVQTLVSVEEYLRQSYRPDCDFIDGVVEERNMGERDHSRLQAKLTYYFVGREKQWNIQALTEVRVCVKESRFRIPDLCVVRDTDPIEQVITTPPLLCVEILSPEDRMSRVLDRIKDYLDFGVPTVWVIDPQTRRAQVHTVGVTREVSDGILRAGETIQVPLAELFD